MPKFLKEILKYGLILGVMSYLLYDAFSHIDKEALEGKTRLQFILSYWNQANLWLIFTSILCAISSHIIRALRWKIALEPIGYQNVSSFNATMAVLNGYFVNLFIPRGGEFSRPLSLEKTDGVPTELGVGTVVSERIIDLIFLLLCIGMVFIFQSELILSLINDGLELIKQRKTSTEFPWKKVIFLGIIALIFLGAILVYLLNKQLVISILYKIKKFSKGIWQGIISIRKLEKRGLFVFYSLLIWVLYYFMLYSMFLAFSQTKEVGLSEVLTVFVVGGIAQAMPLPNGAGSYHLMVSYTLSSLAAISLPVSIAIVTLLHGIHTIVLIFTGGISVYFISKNTKYVVKR
jgi:glycosyltransferase 2 family protein